MDRVVNLPLLSHPVNWLVVWTVLLFGGMGWAIVHRQLSPAKPSPQGN